MTFDNPKYNRNFQRLSTPADSDRLAQFVVRQARRLLRKSGLVSPPVDADKIAYLQGITKVSKQDLGDTSGLLIPRGDGFEIVLNSTQSPVRQNFSCAHEIGHTFFLETEGLKLTRLARATLGETKANCLIESMCDLAAGELLMPSDLFTKHAASYYFNIASLMPLSGIFKTSIEATAIRLCDLNPRYCLLLYSVPQTSASGSREIVTKWLTRSGLTQPKSKSRLRFSPKVQGMTENCQNALSSNKPVFSRGRVGISGKYGEYQIWSLGFESGASQFILSLLFPE